MTTTRSERIDGHGGQPRTVLRATDLLLEGAAGQRPVVVASVPAGHPYVRSIDGSGCVILPDPPVAGAPQSQWWPPVMLDAGWIRDHAEAFDVMHVHFGTESRSVDELRAFVGALRDVGRPLVFTAHDLEHPHLHVQSRYEAQLDVLMHAADAVLTLTDAAATEIQRRFGVRARVVPHPQLAPDGWFSRADDLRARRAGERPVVALHLRDLRANVRPGAWLSTLSAATRAADAQLRILVNDRPGRSTDDVDLLQALLAPVRDDDHVEILVRPRPDDDALAHELAGATVSVLPYAHGTHSGWLELCWDLGTRVLSPRVGALASQHAEPWFIRFFDAARPAELVPSLGDLLRAPVAPASAQRLALRRRVLAVHRDAHASVYRDVLGQDPRDDVSGPASRGTGLQR